MDIEDLYQRTLRLLSTALAQGKISQATYDYRLNFLTAHFEEAGSPAAQIVVCKAIASLCK